MHFVYHKHTYTKSLVTKLVYIAGINRDDDNIFGLLPFHISGIMSIYFALLL